MRDEFLPHPHPGPLHTGARAHVTVNVFVNVSFPVAPFPSALQPTSQTWFLQKVPSCTLLPHAKTGAGISIFPTSIGRAGPISPSPVREGGLLRSPPAYSGPSTGITHMKRWTEQPGEAHRSAPVRSG